MVRFSTVGWQNLGSDLSILVAVLLFLGVGTPASAQPTVGLQVHEEGAADGYTLFAPIPSEGTYLIDNLGRQVHSWAAATRPGLSVYLLENGNLLLTGQDDSGGGDRFDAAGGGGLVQEIAWDGTPVWSYVYSSGQHRQHHDVERLPNGNVLLVAWELKTSTEAIAAGRDPALLRDGELWPLVIVEVQPVGLTGGTIVWEWHVWDHLVQDFDPTKPEFKVVADSPERIDLNYDDRAPTKRGQADWLHTNAIAYNAQFDQIVVSVHGFSEIWVIDHSTTTAEAAGTSGGNSGKGGDILYRWGNPRTYDRGTVADQRLFQQHDAHWIAPGLPGAGNLLVFSNGRGRPGGNSSSVDEIVPPVDENGFYTLMGGAAFGPADPVWSYQAPVPTDFFAPNVSGAARMANGNTLICNGPVGTFFEVTPAGSEVWRYVSPVTGTGVLAQGDPPVGNSVFRAPRYAPDYPGLSGKLLVPGRPLELFDDPLPVPPGSGATDPLTVSKQTASGDWLQVGWDASACPAAGYNLIYGDLVDIAHQGLLGSECAIGDGSFEWSGVPAESLYFMVVGVDATGVYESSWGTDSSGAERNGAMPSGQCGVTTKIDTEVCSQP